MVRTAKEINAGLTNDEWAAAAQPKETPEAARRRLPTTVVQLDQAPSLAQCATTRQSGSSLDVVALALATITAGHSGDCSAQLLPLGGSIYHGTSPRRRGGANFFGDE